MSLSILTVGKKHDSWIQEGIQEYQKRLSAPFTVEWELIPPSGLSGEGARKEETKKLTDRSAKFDFVILLDERGTSLTSPHLSDLITPRLHTSEKIALIIGGAFGVDESLRQKADFVWSLSPLVFPHQLVRLILIEQLYRAQEISRQRPYHHE